MDDRTLIERAAKAAGIEIDKSPYNGGGLRNTGFDLSGNAVLDWHNYKTWNPLTDDGDIARLEADCEINVRWMALGVSAANRGCDLEAFERYDAHNGDKQKARRYASTRAAASLAGD